MKSKLLKCLSGIFAMVLMFTTIINAKEFQGYGSGYLDGNRIGATYHVTTSGTGSGTYRRYATGKSSAVWYVQDGRVANYITISNCYYCKTNGTPTYSINASFSDFGLSKSYSVRDNLLTTSYTCYSTSRIKVEFSYSAIVSDYVKDELFYANFTANKGYNFVDISAR